mmetsp:Transcript_28752/g.27674  ORF Transcript_28752/g.27674 Transcript_28752/m.27674 type:complete len:469 (-) Transcript_28752:247-1653(-)|eukprot:CAMPEP_0197833544 /NCGR_PEP_ID=MMETSP1437-20131217/19388_1 /TAXON_ID=49252 ORGANISM="Eucampia antarctica, Strain CCMP1452" /NCGR_SAMPLE_ID=MMETSP1437 /ASSEMBLY_ACC=CAM_ASM_001096 /LENGTH=468 /DNA_ID=CAMNT_0043437663 /DNA_START=111 /DNA_END=1517 /DNA_ORIENTATION=+
MSAEGKEPIPADDLNVSGYDESGDESSPTGEPDNMPDEPPPSPPQGNIMGGLFEANKAEEENAPTVKVSDPMQHGEGRSLYTTYRVFLGTPPDITSNVRRRYSDFQWLYSRLQAERPGAIIPIIPHQMALQKKNRFSSELIKHRMINLNRFLTRVIVHPELKDAPCVNVFLKTADNLFEEQKKYAKVETQYPVSNPSKMDKIRHNLVRTAVSLTVAGGQGELEETEIDPVFVEIKEYLKKLEFDVKQLCVMSSKMMKGTKERGESLQNLSKTLNALDTATNTEPDEDDYEEEVSTNPVLQGLIKRLEPLATLSAEQSWYEHTTMVDRFKELERDVQAIKLALQRRRDHRISYTARVKEVKTKQKSVDKIAQSDAKPGKTDKLNSSQMELQTAKELSETARVNLDEVSKRIMREMDRFEEEMQDTVQLSIVNFAQVQVEYSNKSIGGWSDLINFRKETKELEESGGQAD